MTLAGIELNQEPDKFFIIMKYIEAKLLMDIIQRTKEFSTSQTFSSRKPYVSKPDS